MKKSVIILGIAVVISGAAVAHIPSGMYCSVETSLPPASLHSVGNATNDEDAFLRNARLCGIVFSTERYSLTGIENTIIIQK